ncbi:MAG: periplasmic solute binding protein, partial [Prosthecobacter sp.]|nr:periplasmic solute binding protein [Prosthecobacter sp.]
MKVQVGCMSTVYMQLTCNCKSFVFSIFHGLVFFMKHFIRSLCFLAAALPTFAATKVASLHPILADLAQQVGGANVEVVEILKPGADIHHFEPAPKDLAEMRGAKLLLASGKGLESFLDKLRDSLGAGVKLVEVGAKIPSIPFEEHHHEEHGEKEHAEKDKDHDEHDHHHGSEDPHWWHSAENMKRAARIVADEL